MKEKKLIIGAHTSASGGAPNALLEGEEIGATTIQLFTSNQKQWKGRNITDKEVDLWFKTLKETGLEQIMSHDSYLINLGAPNPEMLEKSRKGFKDEIERALKFKLSYVNFHPGAALKEDPQKCLDTIVESVLECESLVADTDLTLLYEATAGQGSTLGYTFEQLGYMVKNTAPKVPVGVCIDTCHIFAAGYDIRTPEAWDNTLKEFDKHVGLKYLRAFHVNDSLKPLGSRVDRHAPLGKGEIGMECFKYLVQNPKTRHLPMYLETPDGPPLWKEEIKLLKKFYKEAKN
ncbi:MAG: deoxyribonuclease IV [Chlamydiia bacterium]|nr:deoxyribonuclease IV [Chlamydiia bacterium]